MTDVLAALGWNAGKRRPTRSLAPRAWWIRQESQPENEEAGILAMIHSAYNSPPAKLRLLESIRSSPHSRYIPCRVQLTNPKHRYHIVSKTPFRLRCTVCRDHLTSGEAMKRFALLLASGQVPRVAADQENDHPLDRESD